MYGSPDVVSYCQHCQRATPMVLDHATGDAICTECAFNLGNGSNACPEPPRWRAAAGHGDSDGDRSSSSSNVGGGASPAAADPLLQGGEGVACSVGAPPVQPRVRGAVVPPKQMRGGGAVLPKMRCGGVPDTSKALAEGLDAIAGMASRLGLADKVSDRGKEVLRKLEEARACPKGRSRDALYAACLHAACRVEGAPRTLKELIAATSDAAATKRDLGKFINAIKRHLGMMEEGGQDQAADMKTNGVGVVVRAGDYLHRYGSAVGMSSQEVSAARRAAGRLDSFDVRRNPQSMAAAIVYMAMQGSGGVRKSVREVSAATGVSESTIKDAYKDLCPHAALLFA